MGEHEVEAPELAGVERREVGLDELDVLRAQRPSSRTGGLDGAGRDVHAHERRARERRRHRRQLASVTTAELEHAAALRRRGLDSQQSCMGGQPVGMTLREGEPRIGDLGVRGSRAIRGPGAGPRARPLAPPPQRQAPHATAVGIAAPAAVRSPLRPTHRQSTEKRTRMRRLRLLVTGTVVSIFAAFGVVPTAQAAVDYFLEIDGVEGESQDAKLFKSVEIEAFSWGASSGEKKVALQDLSVSKFVDLASPQLFQRLVQGTTIPSVELIGRTSGEVQTVFLPPKRPGQLAEPVRQSGERFSEGERDVRLRQLHPAVHAP